ncbi:MAG: nicotinamide riboside transporter PnuC [Flavobacteriales bacterium]|nr:nicotinamide riboside transporter PnuC [Flavobacteriales bacterium]
MELPIEIAAVVFNIAYVLLAARGSIWCWPMGIIGSGLSIWLFIKSGLYAESVLFTYYVFMGFYGWYAWIRSTENRDEIQIRIWNWPVHSLVLIGGFIASYGVYYILENFTDAQMPLLDAYTTVFSFIATWMVAKRILENWVYWIAIDALTIYLYVSRELYIYAALSAAFTVIAFYGYAAWYKSYTQSPHQTNGSY